MTPDVWTREALEERALQLQQQAAAGHGEASTLLERYDGHYTMLACRARSGGAELHRDWVDIFFILDGEACLVSGGAIEQPQTTGEGEVRGAGLTGGQSRTVKAGDVLHIPAGTTHQMLVAEGESVTYFVVKAREGQ